MNKILLVIAFSLVSIHTNASDNPLKQSIAILESNYGDMTVEMIKLDDNKWKLSSRLVGTGIKREESEYLYLVFWSFNFFMRPRSENNFSEAFSLM